MRSRRRSEVVNWRLEVIFFGGATCAAYSLL